MRSNIRSLVLAAVAVAGAHLPASGAPTQIVYLSGRGPSSAVPWEFFCTKGRQGGVWTHIPVPSNWELQGFGDYDYGLVKNKHDERGLYRRHFDVPEAWAGRRVRVVFDGVMTDADVRVNGRSAGPVHQGGFYRFRFDVTDLLKPGADNLLEVDVSKKSANPSVEAAERHADYWVFGGIYRPVFLEILPEQFIDRVAIRADADGRFRAEVFPLHVGTAGRVEGRVETTDGKPVSSPFSARLEPGGDRVVLETTVTQPRLWSAETPDLYVFRGTLMAGDKAVHEIAERFGFRTLELRAGQGIYLNGRRILLQGFDRHCFRPESGRALDPADSLADVRLLKELNANAVRCSHYPPDPAFLDACDEHGIYVLDELCTWQKPILETTVARKLVRELVERDVNHPAVLFWDNGNEGGFNLEVDDEYAACDPQQRQVLHPWADFRGIDTAHYRTYDQHLAKLRGPDIYLATELLHGLYDGGMGAGLDDYWQALRDSKVGGGAFLWAFADEGVVRTDQDGRIDTDGNHAPDGILGPHHQHEGSFDTVRAIWSPVHIPLTSLPEDFSGRLPVANRYAFRPLGDVAFAWELLVFSAPREPAATRVVSGGKLTGPAVAAAGTGHLQLPLPANWREAQALRVTASGPDGSALMTWVWPVPSRARLIDAAFQPGAAPAAVSVLGEDGFTVRSGNAEFRFSRETGQLLRTTIDGKAVALGAGPRLVAEAAATQPLATPGAASVRTTMSNGNVVVVADHGAGLDHFEWTVHPGGVLQLDYKIVLPAAKYHYAGIGFDLEERAVKSKRWLGGGPFRVWNNRMAGPAFGIWENAWNDGVAGERWELPEFKGIFKDVVWMRLDCGATAVTVGLAGEHALLGVLRPPNGGNPAQAVYAYPETDGLFVLHAIPAIGNKFHTPDKVGPQSQPTPIDEPLTGSVWLRFE